MNFVGIEKLPEHEPVIEIRRGTFVVDLHNDAAFEGFEIRRAQREVVLRWRARGATWRHEGDQVIAGTALVFREVQKCIAKGTFISERRNEIPELDFVEHSANGTLGIEIGRASCRERVCSTV